MKTKTTIILITLFVCELIFFFSAGKVKDIFIQEHLKNETEALRSSYNAGISNARNIANAFYNVMINSNPDILKLFAEADVATPKRQNEIRKEMYEKLRIIYEQQVKLGLKQLHFHTRDSVSFLRMHKPDEYGDSLAGIRHTVDAANRLVRYTEGFEEGRIFNGFRFVYPLVYNSVHIGSVEISISSVYLANTMNTTSAGIHDFLVKKSVVDSTVFPSEQYNYAQSELSDNYLRENISYEYLQENATVFGSIEEYLYACEIFKPIIKERMDMGEAFSIHSVINGKEVTASFLPIPNILDQQVAYFVKMERDNKYRHILNIYKAALVGGSITILLVFGVIFLSFLNGHKTIILNTFLDEKLKENENQLYIKEQMLFQQSKLATLGEMFSSLAHQWKQPLNILAMYVQNMLDDDMDEEERKHREDIVDKCMAQITFMSETINDFMDFILPSGNIEMKMDMVRTAEEILKLLNPTMAKKKIDITIDSKGKKSVFAAANPNEFKHVMVNLLNNAKDAIMDVKEKNKMFVGNINIEIEESGAVCIMRISDNGGGINPEALDKIFTPYFTTKKKKDGSGLGLYMCKKIIQKHNGDMNVSNSDSGAVFEIILPSVKTDGRME
ncbi:MAG: ATP-binding protein [Deferribacterales bacterium]